MLQASEQLTMMHNSFKYIQKLDETLHHNTSCIGFYNVPYMYYYICTIVSWGCGRIMCIGSTFKEVVRERGKKKPNVQDKVIRK